MTLNRYQFEVLAACAESPALSQREMAARGGISVGSANKALKALKAEGLVNAANKITAAGRKALEPYAVDNAIILAAGMATRFAPLSFERPKAMFEVRGEVLIERLIRQLKEAGIDDITVVTGYKKEAFFYLEDEFGVKIAVNHEYADRNNNSSLHCVRDRIGNSYIIASDQYYTRNIFRTYCYAPYCSVCPSKGDIDRQIVVVDSRGQVVGAQDYGTDDGAFCMQGPAYFDRAFSQAFMGFLEAEYAHSQTAGMYWEQIFAEHVADLHMLAQTYEPGTIIEFDCITDLVAFDRDFFANVDSRILDNICRTLDCSREDITDVVPISAGLTNLSTLFSVGGQKYIYRHPGEGTDQIVNRRAEAFALNVASELGLDDTFVYEEPSEGWKISRYIDGCSELDYADRGQVGRALQMVRTLHTSGRVSPYSFDFYDEGVHIIELLRGLGYPFPKDFDSLAARVGAIVAKMRPEAGEPVLCHNDFYGPNFLVKGDEMRLIDWEYAAMGDYACDLGNFVAQGSGYTVEQTLDMLPLYYGRPVTQQEQRYCLAAVALVGWYWYVWAMYKEAMGNPVGEWFYIWYRAAKLYTAAAEEMYGLA